MEIDEKEAAALQSLKTTNLKCPFCGSLKIVEEDKSQEYGAGVYSSISRCQDKSCEARWREAYGLFAITLYQEPKGG